MNTSILDGQFDRFAGMVPADWTGSAQAPASLLRRHLEWRISTPLGNTHSSNVPSQMAQAAVDETREQILKFFNADPDRYAVILTGGATDAIRILRYYLYKDGALLLARPNHNSVVNLRVFAEQQGVATVDYAPLNDDLSLNEEALLDLLQNKAVAGANNLFAFPAKSNYSGVYHDLSWVTVANELGWDTLLDAAAYVANARLDLSKVQPTFVPISFYKMFGFPTGAGCLLIRKDAFERMHKPDFAGGTVRFSGVDNPIFVPADGYEEYENGSLNFGEVPAIRFGLDFLEELGDCKSHVIGLTTWLYDALQELGDDQNRVVIYSPRGTDIITFSVIKNGVMVDPFEFEAIANQYGISIRAGCFCNPGENEEVFKYLIKDLDAFVRDLETSGDPPATVLLRHTDIPQVGGIRASFGYINTMEHMRTFARFVDVFLNS